MAVSRTLTRERWLDAARAPLTARELEIVTLLGHGLKNREIAGRLHITTKTVRNHLSRGLDALRSRLGVRVDD